MAKLLTILGAVFAIAGLFNFWGLLLRPAGFDPGTIGLVDIISFWGGLAMLCVAAGLVLHQRRQNYYNSED